MWRTKLSTWIESNKVQNFIIGIIVFNALQLGLQTSDMVNQYMGEYFDEIDMLIATIFVLEIVVKLIAIDVKFFKSGWNVFDLIIVIISALPESTSLRALRTIRILRVLRLVRKLPRLRILIEAVLRSLPSLNWVTLLLLIVFYIFGIIGTSMFGGEFKDWFGTLGKSMYTLFQVMTLESWSMGISRPVMEKYPYAWLYFIPFIMLATYTSINIFIAIMVSTMQNLANAEQHEKTERTPVEESHPITQLMDIPQKENEIISLLKSLESKIEKLEQEIKNLKNK